MLLCFLINLMHLLNKTIIYSLHQKKKKKKKYNFKSVTKLFFINPPYIYIYTGVSFNSIMGIVDLLILLLFNTEFCGGKISCCA